MVKDIFVGGNGGWLGAVARLGLPIVLSLLLTSFLIFRVDTALGQVQASINNDVMMMTTAKAAMENFRVEQTVNQRILRRLALQTCRNTAKNDAQLQACDSASEE